MHYVLAIVALIAVWLLFSLHEHSPNQPHLPEAEQSYYEQVFNYTMDNTQAGNHFDWKTYDASGSIALAEAFISKSGYTCRSFAENYSVGGEAQTDKGYGCKRIGRIGWCKLNPDDALTCALENPSYHVSLPGMGPAPETPDVNINAPTINGPHINTNTNSHPANTKNGNNPTATDAANTITGTAGTAAGYVAKNAGGWFSSLFR